jgi:hypothetical protein
VWIAEPDVNLETTRQLRMAGHFRSPMPGQIDNQSFDRISLTD